MPSDSHSTDRTRIPSSALVGFVAITFLITWGLIGVYIVFPEAAATRFGEISGSHPFFFLATWSPAIAAFVIVFLYSGTSGIRAFVSRLVLRIGNPTAFTAISLRPGGLSSRNASPV